MPFEFQARCDPRNLGFAEAKQAYLRMTGLEYLEYFRKKQNGFFSTVLIYDRNGNSPLFSERPDVTVPTRQMGYCNIVGRLRERTNLYDPQRLEEATPPLLRRRSSVLYNLPILPELLRLESSFTHKYELSARDTILTKYPMFRKDISSNNTCLDDVMHMLLLPVCLEKARMSYLLSYASREVLLTHNGGSSYTARIRNAGGSPKSADGDDDNMNSITNEDFTALTAAVGGKVQFTGRNRWGEYETVDMFVRSLSEDILDLVLLDRADFTKERRINPAVTQNCFVFGVKDFGIFARFLLSEMEFKLQETGIIDGMSGCGSRWFGNTGETFLEVGAAAIPPPEDEEGTGEPSQDEESHHECPKKKIRNENVVRPNREKRRTRKEERRKTRQVHPLISEHQLAELKKGRGFYTKNLSKEQRRAVVMFVGDEIECDIQTLVGGAGCGKTAVLDEVLLQINRHHVEDVPGSALVLLAVPTNLCAGKAVERLIGKGFPPKQILHVIGEQAAATHGKAFKHPTVRVTNYEHNEEVQLIVATVQVMPRIFMLKVTIKGLFQKSALLIAVEEACATPAGLVLAALVAAGEPQRVLLVGDPCQLLPRFSSKTATLLFGNVSLLDLLKRRNGYFEPDADYPTPIAPNGVFLRENFRASSGLVNLVSVPFYGRRMFATQLGLENCHNRETARLMGLFQVIPILKNLSGPVIWIDVECAYGVNVVNHSLCNPGEFHFARRLACAMGDIVGDDQIVFIAPYQEHVTHAKARMHPRRMVVGTADEFQGSEASIVVMNLVRSSTPTPPAKYTESLGFLKCRKRTNSMMTRAKNLVLIIGSLNHFTRGGSESWSHIANCAEVRVVR